MSSRALALSIEEETTQDATTVDAVIAVNAKGDDITLASTSPGILVAGTTVILQPASSAVTPVTYNLKFEAGTGVDSFDNPAAELWVESTREKIAIAVNRTTSTSFLTSFINNLEPKDDPQAISFTISYVPSGQTLVVRKDPTFLLDPPNS